MTVQKLMTDLADKLEDTAEAFRGQDLSLLTEVIQDLSKTLGDLKQFVDQLGDGMAFQWMVPHLVKAFGIKASTGQSFNITQLRALLKDVGLDLDKMDDNTLRRSMRAVMRYDLLAQHGIRFSKFYSGGYTKYQAHRIYDEEDV